MISVSQALSIVERETSAIGIERVVVTNALGRILSEDVVADMDLPPFDRSQMDGFALRSDDVRSAPVELRIAGESAAGKGWHRHLQPGEAVRIMTGAPVPIGADTVQKVELTSEANFSPDAGQNTSGSVTIFEPVGPDKNIVRRGTEIKKGERVITAGERINARSIAVLAAFGYSTVSVSRQPRVAILTTGSEVVDIDKTPGPDQIRNSNSAMLEAMVRAAGGVTDQLGSATDDLEPIKSTLINAANRSDVIITTGGVSVGKYDLTKLALTELEAEIFFDKLRLKPGKPAVLARLGNTLVFGLPGNPVSAAVTFYLFVRKALMIMQNAKEPDLKTRTAVAAADLKAAGERDTYLPVRVDFDGKAGIIATPLKWIGSSDFVGFAGANGLAFVTAGKRVIKGEIVKVLFLDE